MSEERADRGVVPARPDIPGSATPSIALPPGASPGLAPPLGETRIGGRRVVWGARTLVMGILNVTPDSFSGDGLLGAGDPVETAVVIARRMVDEGADILDVGGESTRPGHEIVDETTEAGRVLPVIRAVRAALPDVAISIDTTKPIVASAAFAAGASLLNDVWGVRADEPLLRVAADHDVPVVLMHNRVEARYVNVIGEVVADLQRAVEAAVRYGVRWENILVDPGIGFGKTPDQNLAVLEELAALRVLARPIVLGTSRKSTLGRLLDLAPDQRVEATIATTVLGVAAGVDVVRVHDVRPNRRATSVADAIVRGWRPAGWESRPATPRTAR